MQQVRIVIVNLNLFLRIYETIKVNNNNATIKGSLFEFKKNILDMFLYDTIPTIKL